MLQWLYLSFILLKCVTGISEVYSQTISTTSCLSLDGSVSPCPVLTGPDMAYLNSRVAFRCIAPDSSPPVTYQLMRDGGIPIAIGTDLQGDQPALFFLKVAATSEGSYHCKATTEGSTGVSNIITLSVVSEYHTFVVRKKNYSQMLLLPFLPNHLPFPLIYSSTIKYQSDRWTFPTSRIRGVTHRPEMQRHKGLPPVLHLVVQQEGSNIFHLSSFPPDW